MIPAVVPPLTSLSVLVTRPAAQAASLAASIRALGGDASVLSTIDIVPLPAQATAGHDLVIFVSVAAVAHGAHHVLRENTTRIAAIGAATAAALAAAGMPATIVPEAGFNSETLLAHPDLRLAAGARVLIVRGVGGRDVLQQTLSAQGCAVETLDVYRRERPTVDAMQLAKLESSWAEGSIHVVTATSVETLSNLAALLSAQGRELLAATPLLVASRRIMQAAIDMGLHADCIVASGADDSALIGALSQWHGRARSS